MLIEFIVTQHTSSGNFLYYEGTQVHVILILRNLVIHDLSLTFCNGYI